MEMKLPIVMLAMAVAPIMLVPRAAAEEPTVAAAVAYLGTLDDVAGFRIIGGNNIWVAFKGRLPLIMGSS